MSEKTAAERALEAIKTKAEKKPDPAPKLGFDAVATAKKHHGVPEREESRDSRK